MNQCRDFLDVRVRYRILADDRDRRGVAPADAGRVKDADAGTEQISQLVR
jgi:hypothetical protein